MKKFFVLLATMGLTIVIYSQAPQKLSYQAVIRNNSGQLVTSHAVGMKISILQGSVSGTTVYTEIYNPNPNTNSNGLVTIEIGGGIPTLGTFSAINWTNGPYFLKTETDPAGGTNYSITDTSQLLSVPYALYAKTAEKATETDPVFGASAAKGITGMNITNWNTAYGWGNHASAGYTPATRTLTINGTSLDLSVNRSWNLGSVTSIATGNGITGGTITTAGTLGLTGQALALHNLSTNGVIVRTGSGTVAGRTIVAGAGITVTNGDGVSGNPAIAVKTYAVGDFAHGGIVFWVDATGQHGLVCAKTDQNVGIRWYARTYGNTRAYGDGPFAGKANTLIIIAAQVAIGDDGATYAARICNELQITEGGKTYGDWYLPSKAELNLMYQNKSAIDATATANGGSAFAVDLYWSSTEYDNNNAWRQNFVSGDQSGNNKAAFRRVRAVRAY